MLVDAGVDTGPILLQRAIPIAEDDTAGSLNSKLAVLGASTLMETLPLWVQGKIAPQPQDNRFASYTHMLHKEDGKIDWNQPADVLARKVRAFIPWPGAYTNWGDRLLKIISAHAIQTNTALETRIGTVSLRKEHGAQTLTIATGNGLLIIEKLQLEGKKVMNADEFLRGYSHIVGEVLD